MFCNNNDRTDPGNLLVPNDPAAYGGAKLALIDCGLMASIDEVDRDNMISAVIHLANKNYAALVDGTHDSDLYHVYLQYPRCTTHNL